MLVIKIFFYIFFVFNFLEKNIGVQDDKVIFLKLYRVFCYEKVNLFYYIDYYILFNV